VIQASSATASVSWTPKTEGKHTLKCVITDSKGASATATKTFTAEPGDGPVPPDVLVNNSSLASTTITAGNSLTMKGAAAGGTSPYQYAYYYKLKSASSWTTVKGLQHSNKCICNNFYSRLLSGLH